MAPMVRLLPGFRVQGLGFYEKGFVGMALVEYGILLQFALQAVLFVHVYLALLMQCPATQATFWTSMSDARITKKRQEMSTPFGVISMRRPSNTNTEE